MKIIKHNSKSRGIALLVALGTMMVILIIGSLAIYLITRGLSIAKGQKQYQSAFEACEGGIEIGIATVDGQFTLNLDNPTGDTLQIGMFQVRVNTQPLFSTTVAGAAIKFARGYSGAGQGISHGGVNVYYLVRAQAIGSSGERIAIEIEQKKTVGVD